MSLNGVCPVGYTFTVCLNSSQRLIFFFVLRVLHEVKNERFMRRPCLFVCLTVTQYRWPDRLQDFYEIR
jgi:hypothetical protein